jgi:hypothetical protein
MGIKLSHRHDDGKECFTVSRGGGHRGSVITQAGIVYMLGGRFGVGYKPYTGAWYGYDLETGEEIATFSRKFYERQLKHLMQDLAPDPECVIKLMGQ